MAYQGYHIKFSDNTTLPYNYMSHGSYQSTPNQRMDLDSYRDGNGILHRTALPHTATKIEWETPYLNNTE